MPKTCFVISPIGDVGTQIRADADDFIKYIVRACPALKEHDYDTPVRADQLNQPGRITSQVIKLLMESELVIADLTGNNANVFYELCLRHALAKPVIHMAAEGTRLPFDVHDSRTIFYTMHSRIAERARDELADQIRYVHQKGYKATNPIVETAGIISLEQSSDPNQNAIAKVMRMVEGIKDEISILRQQSSGINLGLWSGAGGLAGTHPVAIGGQVGTYPPSGLFGLASLGRQSEADPTVEEVNRAVEAIKQQVERNEAEKLAQSLQALATKTDGDKR
jgi:hypothetical protein